MSEDAVTNGVLLRFRAALRACLKAPLSQAHQPRNKNSYGRRSNAWSSPHMSGHGTSAGGWWATPAFSHASRICNGVPAMVETRSPEEASRDERTLVERLIYRQGLMRDDAERMVVDYRRGKRVEIDPILMEGLDAI
jgi:hypothetical protein